MNRIKQSLWTLAGIALVASQTHAATHTVTFDTLPDSTATVHGLVVADQWDVAPFELSIDVINYTGAPHTAALFDSGFTGSTTDSDLIGPPWNGGNLAVDADNVQLGRMLYIEESGTSFSPGDIVPNPDDEGSRPAGKLIFDFGTPIDSFGFDLIDVEGPAEIWEPSNPNPTGFFASFFTDSSATPLAVVGFNELIDNSSPYYDSSIQFGNNSANRVVPFTLASLGLDGVISGFSRVEIGLGGSGAVDNLVYTTPVPPPPVVPMPRGMWTGMMMLSVLGVGYGVRRRPQTVENV